MVTLTTHRPASAVAPAARHLLGVLCNSCIGPTEGGVSVLLRSGLLCHPHRRGPLDRIRPSWSQDLRQERRGVRTRRCGPLRCVASLKPAAACCAAAGGRAIGRRLHNSEFPSQRAIAGVSRVARGEVASPRPAGFRGPDDSSPLERCKRLHPLLDWLRWSEWPGLDSRRISQRSSVKLIVGQKDQKLSRPPPPVVQ